MVNWWISLKMTFNRMKSHKADSFNFGCMASMILVFVVNVCNYLHYKNGGKSDCSLDEKA